MRLVHLRHIAMNKIKTAKSLKKPPPLAGATRDADNDMQFELELCWCVQQLENAINSGKLSQKVAEDTAKNVKTLKSSTAPLIKKRQVMKAALGDYRAKMKDEEKKMALAAKQIKFTANADANKKSNFVKKAAILTSGHDFRFNFNPPTTGEQADATAFQSSGGVPETDSKTFISKDLNLTSGSGFKFNFTVDETNEELNLNALSIKN